MVLILGTPKELMRRVAKHASSKEFKCRIWLPINITIIIRCSSPITMKVIWLRPTPSLKKMSSVSLRLFLTLDQRTVSAQALLVESTRQDQCLAATTRASTSWMLSRQTIGSRCTKQDLSWLKGLHKKSSLTLNYPRQCTLSSCTRCQYGPISNRRKLMRAAHLEALMEVPLMSQVTPRSKTITQDPLVVPRER